MQLTKDKIIIVVFTVLLLVGAFVYGKGVFTNKQQPENKPPSAQTAEVPSAEIVSTKPDPLDKAVIPADQIIEITFNKPLRAPSELKLRIEPETKYKIELSEDRKTAKIIIEKPFELNTNYAFYIGADTKFDGIDRWGKDITYRFQTIKFRGL